MTGVAGAGSLALARTPADSSEPRPTLYLINGSGGGQGIATWEKQTDVEEHSQHVSARSVG